MRLSKIIDGNRWLLALALAGLVGGAAACSDDDDDDTSNDDDDTSGNLCADVVCDENEICNGATGQCVPLGTDLCEDVTCGTGEVCDGTTGECVPLITDKCEDVTCDDDEVCDGATGECVPLGSGCPDGTTALPGVDGVCTISGELREDVTLTAGNDYLLRGGVFVGDDENATVLTIEPGVTIFGEAGTDAVSMLVVRRGSKIMAEGTKEAPIVFTSSKEDGARGVGDWGGVIINGRAPVNTCPAGTELCEAQGEGGTGTYGGTNAADNSGILKYVRIEFAGKRITETNELNGLALQGVGTGTVLDYIQIHRGADDAIEFFGGTVNARHLLLTHMDDDGLDWTFGWNGKVQYLVVQQFPGVGNQGIEADNNEVDNNATPRSHPVLSHMTFIGASHPSQTNNGIHLRRGTAGNLYNFIVQGFNGGCLDIDSKATYTNAHVGGVLNGELTMEKSIINCTTPFTTNDEKDNPATPAVEENPEETNFTVPNFFNTLNEGNSLEDPMLRAAANTTAPDFRPGSGSPALSGAVFPGDSFFENKSFRGGVDPDSDWTQGWTSYSGN